TREESEPIELVLPVHLIDELVQILDLGSHVALLEFAVEALQSLREEILDDDSIALARGCRAMSGSQQGNRRIILMVLKALQLARTDQGQPCLPAKYQRVGNARDNIRQAITPQGPRDLGRSVRGATASRPKRAPQPEHVGGLRKTPEAELDWVVAFAV